MSNVISIYHLLIEGHFIAYLCRSHAEDKLGVCLVVAVGRQDEDLWVGEPVDHALMVHSAWLLQLWRFRRFRLFAFLNYACQTPCLSPEPSDYS